MEMRLPDDFKEFLKLCNAKKLEYMVIGGFAVAHYGYCRPTADIDIWIRRSDANAQRMVKVLQAFGFDQPGLNAVLFLEPEKMLRIGVSPVRIEILNDISGVAFDACYGRRIESRWERVKVPVISLEDLLANKTASAHLKDLIDVESLTGVNPPEKRRRTS